jgi:hypothetical protein
MIIVSNQNRFRNNIYCKMFTIAGIVQEVNSEERKRVNFHRFIGRGEVSKTKRNTSTE